MALHSVYPHEPGRLPGCPACDWNCNCGPGVEAGTETECVYLGHETSEAVCPVCGEFISYCQGHGEIGDPAGYQVMQEHDEGIHFHCAVNAGCEG